MIRNKIFSNVKNFSTCRIKNLLKNKIDSIDDPRLLVEINKCFHKTIEQSDFKKTNKNMNMNFGISFPDNTHTNSYIKNKSNSIINIYGVIDKNEIIKEIFDYICNNPDGNNSEILEHVDDLVKNSINNSITNVSYETMNKKYEEINVKYIINRIKYLTSVHCFIYFDISKRNLINEIYMKTLQRITDDKSPVKGISDKDFDDIIKNNCYVSYLHGVLINIDFSTFPIIDYKQYDKEYGKNSFIKTIYEINGYMIFD